MLSKEGPSPHILVLAERLLGDIRQRGLSVGDRYLTTEEVSRSLGVGKAAAGKAMRHLAERGILVSRQRSGTFIGPGVEGPRQSKVQTLQVLLPSGNLGSSHWSYQPFIAGIRRAIPGINVQFAFVPETDPVPYLQELIDGARAAGQLSGVIAVSCPLQVYRYLAELGVPAVVFGSLYSSDLAITSVDVDGYEAGRLLTRYLVERGHRRIAVMLSTSGRPGDNAFLDGSREAMAAAGLSCNDWLPRLTPNDLETFQAVARELLRRADRPTGIVTRGAIQADAIASAAAELEKEREQMPSARSTLRAAPANGVCPLSLEIAVEHGDQTTPHVDMQSYPRVRPKLSFVEIAESIGQLLKAMPHGLAKPPERILLPVEFHWPAERILDSD